MTRSPVPVTRRPMSPVRFTRYHEMDIMEAMIQVTRKPKPLAELSTRDREVRMKRRKTGCSVARRPKQRAYKEQNKTKGSVVNSLHCLYLLFCGFLSAWLKYDRHWTCAHSDSHAMCIVAHRLVVVFASLRHSSRLPWVSSADELVSPPQTQRLCYGYP